MKFIFEQKTFSENLSSVIRAVPGRPTHPILANVLIEATQESNQITLTGFDLILGIQSSVTASVETGGKVTLPAKLLAEIVSKLQGQITLETSDDESGDNGVNAVLTSASGRFQLRGMKAEEFPDIPIPDEAQTFTIPVKVFTDGLKSTLFAASTDETKQILTGIHLRGESDYLEFAATDGHRLSTALSPIEDVFSEGFAMTIPARGLHELSRILNGAKPEDTLTMVAGNDRIILSFKNQTININRLIGDYPKYTQLMPTNFSRTVTMERKRLLQALELVSLMSDNKYNQITVTVNKEDVTIWAKTEVGTGNETIPAQVMGEGGDVRFNVKYLLEGMRAMTSTEVVMKLNEPTHPVIFSPIGEARANYLLMPIQIRE